MTAHHDIVFAPATELAQRIRTKQISATEVAQAHLKQVEAVNPKLNAIVTLVADKALAVAKAADEKQARGEPLGLLHGLPTVHKDLAATAGVRTTYGSPIFKDHVPTENMLIVQRQHDAGAIMLGKSNTPEFGAGSQTFNAVFGKTANPYDLTKTCGGSSGGAAVALAAGMAALADGSDLGGSLRNPASFCNVVGLRASAGRVPIYPFENLYFDLSVEGAMGRTVADVALMMQAIAGPDRRVPISLDDPATMFAAPLERNFKGTRIAWAADLLGKAPVDTRVAAAINAQRGAFEGLGCVSEEALPDFTGADEVFQTQRAVLFSSKYAGLMRTHGHLMKDTVIWNIEAGLKLTSEQIGRAPQLRSAVFLRMHAFFQKYDFLIMPAAQVLPFDIDTPYPTEINGQTMPTYLDWMKTCYWVTVTGHPAISVPCGFSPEGLPVGVQIVGKYRDDMGVLQLAHAFEQATKVGLRRPPGV
jgi:amidase